MATSIGEPPLALHGVYPVAHVDGSHARRGGENSRWHRNCLKIGILGCGMKG
jgi:hypothetical protein